MIRSFDDLPLLYFSSSVFNIYFYLCRNDFSYVGPFQVLTKSIRLISRLDWKCIWILAHSRILFSRTRLFYFRLQSNSLISKSNEHRIFYDSKCEENVISLSKKYRKKFSSLSKICWTKFLKKVQWRENALSRPLK